jgi:hypothetical protein
MDNGALSITRLTGFGLSEKEAHLYLHLRKYGPKTPLASREVDEDVSRRRAPYAYKLD